MEKGYSFDWVEGEMYEKSPFTLLDYIKQRKRWLQGLILVVHSKMTPLKHKIFIILSTYSNCIGPLVYLQVLFDLFFPTNSPIIIDLLWAFIGGVSLYVHLIGTYKTCSTIGSDTLETIVNLVLTIGTLPLKIVLENAAVVWALLSKKHQFYIVNKNHSKIQVSVKK